MAASSATIEKQRALIYSSVFLLRPEVSIQPPAVLQFTEFVEVLSVQRPGFYARDCGENHTGHCQICFEEQERPV
jgi:hypothetical protein